MAEFHPCVVIPIYNHKKTIADVVTSLAHLKIPCLIVDDASNVETQKTLAKLADGIPVIRAFRASTRDGERDAWSAQGSRLLPDQGGRNRA